MKLYLCEIRSSVSPAVIANLPGKFPKQVGKTAIAFFHASPLLIKTKYDVGIMPNQCSVIRWKFTRSQTDYARCQTLFTRSKTEHTRYQTLHTRSKTEYARSETLHTQHQTEYARCETLHTVIS